MCLLGPEHWNFERSPKIHHGETHFLGVLTFFFIRNTQNMGFPMINFWAPFKKSIFRTQSTQNSLWINSTQICRYVHFWCRNWPDYLLVYTCCLSYILLLILVLFYYQFDFCKHWQLDLNQVCHGQLAEALPLTYTDSCMLSSCGVFIFHLWPNVHFNSSVQPNTEDRIQGKLTSESMGVAVPPRAPWNFHFISFHIISYQSDFI